jgi:hypothetical protein
MKGIFLLVLKTVHLHQRFLEVDKQHVDKLHATNLF